MNTNRKEIKLVAWHEAGHTTHALATGMPFHGVWVRRDSDERCPLDESSHPSLKRDKVRGALLVDRNALVNDYTFIDNCMAGLAGERIMRKTKTAGKVTFYAYLTGCASDIDGATERIKEHNADPRSKFQLLDKYLDIALGTAWRTLKKHSKVHKAIAETLIERGYLSYAECEKLYEENA
jgi:hypothetical protein